MLTFRNTPLLAFVLAWCVAPSVLAAEDPKGGELPTPKPTPQEIAYVSIPDVQREIGVTAAQAASMADLWKQHQELLSQRQKAGGTKEEYLAQMQAQQLEFENKALELLGDKQSRRLAQVAMQLEGHRLLARTDLKKTLKLSDEQTERLAKIQKEHSDEASKEFVNTRNVVGANPKARGDAIARLIALDARTEKEMRDVLTVEQSKRLDALLGPPVPFRQAFLDRRHQMSN